MKIISETEHSAQIIFEPSEGLLLLTASFDRLGFEQYFWKTEVMETLYMISIYRISTWNL